MIIYCASPRRIATLVTALLLPWAAPRAQAAGAWRFTAPEGAAAWFTTLDAARLGAPGPFPYYRGVTTPRPVLARTLAAQAEFEVLHFIPLYFPTASRDELARAVSLGSTEAAPSPRSAFVTGVLAATLPTRAQRDALARVTDEFRRASPTPVADSAIRRWQQAWDARFAAALAPYLAGERLDSGVVMVVDVLGPEGRLFGGRPGDRADNVAAVGTVVSRDDADAPLFALVRELCFPLVTRAALQRPVLRASRDESARRTSLAAVRCGAELLDALLPAEGDGYRRHWQRAATGAPTAAGFDTLFPPDPLLAPRIRAGIARVARYR